MLDSLLPLDVLFEDAALATVELPSDLHRLYGSDLGFDEPRVYANFVSTLDGVVSIPSIPGSNRLINMESEADRFVMGLLRAFADVVLVGSGVLRASPRGTWRAGKVYPGAEEAFAELRARLGKPPAPEVAILTGSGSIDPAHPVLGSRSVVLTSSVGSERLDGRLPPGTSLVELGEDLVIDGKLVVDALLDRGHRLILSEAGPHAFGSLLQAGVVDELFLTLSPLLLGDEGAPRFQLVEGADLLELDCAARLTTLRHSGDQLFLRYELGDRRI